MAVNLSKLNYTSKGPTEQAAILARNKLRIPSNRNTPFYIKGTFLHPCKKSCVFSMNNMCFLHIDDNVTVSFRIPAGARTFFQVCVCAESIYTLSKITSSAFFSLIVRYYECNCESSKLMGLR